MRGKICIILLATVVMVGIVSNSAVAQKSSDLCAKTSQDILKSCNSGVDSDYWLAIANCENLPTQDDGNACAQEAKQDKKSSNVLYNMI